MGSTHWLITTPGVSLITGTRASKRAHRARRRRPARSRADLRQRRRPRERAEHAGIAVVPYFDNSTMMEVDFLPEHLVIVGGSYVGLEFAQMYRRFGSRVTVDRDGSAADRPRGRRGFSGRSRKILEGEGIAFRLNAKCVAARAARRGRRCRCACEEEPREIVGSHLLLAVGRRAEHRRPGPRQGGRRDRRARLHHGRRRAAHQRRRHLGAGRCNGRGAFTHTSYNDYEIVAANLLDGEHAPGQRPHPDLRAVHRSAARPRRHDRARGARRRARSCSSATMPMTRVGRAHRARRNRRAS